MSAGGHRGNPGIPADVESRADVEARRAAGEFYEANRRSPNRPTHVEVDDGAWATVKCEAIRQRLCLGTVVGVLVKRAVEGGLPDHSEHHSGPVTGRRANRFARLLGVDDDEWLAFRTFALDANVSTARAVGLVVETEARLLGWKPEVER